MTHGRPNRPPTSGTSYLRRRTWHLHLLIWLFAVPTLLPFIFMVNNSFRTTSELYNQSFGFPRAFAGMASAAWKMGFDADAVIELRTDERELIELDPGEAFGYWWKLSGKQYRQAWQEVRPYMVNTLIVAAFTAAGVLLLGSVAAYVLSRYRFPGHKVLFFFFISTMMFPAVLTLVPSFLLVKELGLINSRSVLILPYVATGQVFAIFVFKSFFDGLPEDLFESARIDGAGHFQIYWNIVLPLSQPVMAVVLVMNIMATWNNFLWPFITNQDQRYHVMASGIYVLARSDVASNYGVILAGYAISAIPLLILFIYATRPFIQGVTSGAFKL